jgi:hypothetical protein
MKAMQKTMDVNLKEMTSRLKAKMGAEIKTIHDKIKRRAS